jgi:hypothetical protein
VNNSIWEPATTTGHSRVISYSAYVTERGTSCGSGTDIAASSRKSYSAFMNQGGETRGTSRDLWSSQIEAFLTEALAGGEQTVVALQEKARAAGLLAEGQSITNAKLFKTTKTALGIRFCQRGPFRRSPLR